MTRRHCVCVATADTVKGMNTMFLVSSIHRHHPSVLHRRALIPDRLLTILMAFSTLVLKLSFSQSLSLNSLLFFPEVDFLEL